ncbi:septum formation initiator [Peptoniphilus sp. BV3AC2]|uniref:septum formation initiator n=1 Tax=Peptoniphilus sp. BV3AC2 TaxID=1111133 RepID=UPI0003B8ED80|nr:septum formation initiator [Peptoniphilus sp. BV3AC2]ERT65191.1 septum formation initiator [Peptoniphilus sp. BV3AC2]
MRSQITKLDNEIIAQSSEIKDLEETKMSLEGELQGIVSSNNLKEVAQYRLGMVYPEDNQIVYIDVKDDKQKSDVKNNVFLSPIVSVLKSFTRN